MANDRLPDPSDPDAVGRAEFATARRGFDQMQVRSYLKVVAQELTRLREREAQLVRENESLLAEAEKAPVELDDAALTARLGEEMTRVLETARAAAAEKVHRAEQTAEELVSEATAEAERITGGAQAAFDAEVEAGRAQGRQLVAEARLVRERMLDDLARRRRTIRTQVEQLRSGRDRLLATHAAVRAALDEIEAELERELPESRTAAALTGRRLQHEPAGSAAMIELEIDEARDRGAPLVSPEELNSKAEDEPADWVNTGAAGASEPTVAEPPESHTDEIPVLDHFGEAEDPEHAEIILAEVGNRRRDHRDLPRDPVPVVEAPDEVEAVRVVTGEAGTGPAEGSPDDTAAAATESTPVAGEDETDAGAGSSDDSEAVAVIETVTEVETVVESEAVVEGETDTGDDLAIEPEPVADVESVGAAAEARGDAAFGGDRADAVEADPDAEQGPDDVAAEPDDVAAEQDDAEAAEGVAGEDDSGSPVDDLFARIRNSRAESVARAREVLDQPFDSASSPGAVATLTGDDQAAAAGAGEPAAEDEPGEVHPDAERIAARDQAVTGIESVIARKLKRMLADEQNEVQDLVRRKRGNVRPDEIVGARDHHVGRYVAAVGGELLAAVSAGASFNGPGFAPKDTDLSVIDDRLADELLDPLRQLLDRGVDEAVGVEDELLDRVRSAYREVKSQRVEIAARVVTLSAFHLGVVEAQPDGGLVRWVVDPVAGCSPDCLDNQLEGAVLAGEAFPTGAVYPPNHPGCRCLLVPTDQ
jgi:cell division septum initiation protein DivIVA